MAAAFEVFAPGKLMLTGEYVVLDGAPALVAAVNRGVSLRCVPEPDSGLLRYGMDAPSPTAAWGAGWTRTQGAAAEGALVDAVLAEIAPFVKDPQGLLGWRWEADTRAMLATHLPFTPKLGLGSSAASAAALTLAALRAAAPSASKDQVWNVAHLAHRRFQGGKGSGADVAASVMGGVIRFQLDPNEQALPSATQALAAHLPSWRGIWTGQSASTTRFLAAIEALRASKPPLHTARMAALREAAHGALDALGDGVRFLEAVAMAEAALDALGEAAGVPIVTETHRRLSRMASGWGLACKPSGAGGGDLSLVFGEDEALGRFVASLHGDPLLWPVDLSLDTDGVRA